MSAEISEWVLGTVAAKISNSRHTPPEVRALCRKLYGSSGYSAEESRGYFALDLEGWPYLKEVSKFLKIAADKTEKDLSKEEERGVQRDRVPHFIRDALAAEGRTIGYELYPLEDIRKMLKEVRVVSPVKAAQAALRAWDVPNTILVEIDLRDKGDEGGSFLPAKFEVVLNPFSRGYLPDWEDIPDEGLEKALKDYFWEVRRIVVHELTHLSQTLISKLSQSLAGNPGKSIRDQNYDHMGLSGKLENLQRTEKVHPLKDVEFYTRLQDEVSLFNHKASNLTSEQRSRAQKLWVGVLSADQDLLEGFGDRYFFQALKKYEPKKWRKAVSEFWKATDE
jgi:hypothetical protein